MLLLPRSSTNHHPAQSRPLRMSQTYKTTLDVFASILRYNFLPWLMPMLAYVPTNVSRPISEPMEFVVTLNDALQLRAKSSTRWISKYVGCIFARFATLISSLSRLIWWSSFSQLIFFGR